MHIQFLGAAGTVTGSRYLVTTDKARVLVDCGLFQGLKQLRLRNWEPFPVSPNDIDAIVLTHAHLDHSGYLPVLVKAGYRGPIYMSRGTRDLCEILLYDSAHLQEEEATYIAKKGFSKHKPPLALYESTDVDKTISLFRVCDYHQLTKIAEGVSIELFLAGHILGASMVRLTAEGKILHFTGDLGRSKDEVMKAPELVDAADYLICESTYGDRPHDTADPSAVLQQAVLRAVSQRGVLVIPAFAVGRTQTILYLLYKLLENKKIPAIPIYLNSPMAEKATDLYANGDEENRLTQSDYQHIYEHVSIVTDLEASKALNNQKGPMVIIAGSGMATGGRVVHHLKQFLPERTTVVLFVGYQAVGTRGADLLNGAKEIKIHGGYVPVQAEIQMLHSLSAHADVNEICAWLQHFKKKPRRLFITHGEPHSAEALRKAVERHLGWNCYVPMHHETVVLD